jgi:hypothetical protein
MKKPLISMLFLILFLSGCWSSYFTYKVTTPEARLFSKNYYQASIGDLYWGGMGYGPTAGVTSASLYQVTEEGHNFLCGFSAQLLLASCNKKRTKEELNKEFGAKRHAFAFFAESWRSSNCEFDNSQVYMIRGSERVQLELVNSKNTEILPYSRDRLERENMNAISNVSRSFHNRAYYLRFFRTPWIDDELENVEIEVGGFYADGIKAPVLRFRMNYRDSIKWRCLDNEPKPSFFKRKWYDIKDFFQNPQEKYNKNSL